MRLKTGQQIIDLLRLKKVDRVDYYAPKKTFSQSGEDIIITFLLENIFKRDKANYLDIGAHHSTWISNTRLLYDKGHKGVLVEPDPCLFKEIKTHRKKDVCLNCGIGFENNESADFYIMNPPSLNTFDKQTAEYNQNVNKYEIKEVVKIPLMKINDIFSKYFSQGCDFCSLDVEGLEMSILNSMDFEKYRPVIFCIETAEHSKDITKSRKEDEIIDFMKSKNYFVYADTFNNTIFVDNIAWNKLAGKF